MIWVYVGNILLGWVFRFGGFGGFVGDCVWVSGFAAGVCLVTFLGWF